MKLVKYPYSNLKNHHSKYYDLIKDIFEMEYNVSVKLNLVPNGYVMNIFNVNPQPIYNPMNFEPGYKVMCKDETKSIISILDIFNLYNKYFSDIIPYLDFNFYTPNNYISLNSDYGGSHCFLSFNHRETYYHINQTIESSFLDI